MASAPEGLGTEWPDVLFFIVDKLKVSEGGIDGITLIEVLSQASVLKYTHSSPHVYRVEYIT